MLSLLICAPHEVRGIFRSRCARFPRALFEHPPVVRAAFLIHFSVDVSLLCAQTLLNGVDSLEQRSELGCRKQPQRSKQTPCRRACAAAGILVFVERGKAHDDHELHRRDQRRQLSAAQREHGLKAREIRFQTDQRDLVVAGLQEPRTACLRERGALCRAHIRHAAQCLQRLPRLPFGEIPVVQQPL